MTEEMITRFITARRNYIAGQFQKLNAMQRKAVLTTEGPLESGRSLLQDPRL